MGNNLNNLKYIVYLTINKTNNKIYIGVHETNNPEKFDGYLGCGAFIDKPSSYNKGKTHLHNAILKYGISSFYRVTIAVFNTKQEALNLENLLVNEEFIKRVDTYNMVCGGSAPPVHIKSVYQFDITGKLIKQWNSVIEVINHYKCNKDRINMCIKDKRSFNGYWSYNNYININEYRLSAREQVFQYNKDKILLNVFENASEAANKLSLDRQAITNAIFDRVSYSGYYFLRADDDILNIGNKNNIQKTKVFRYNIDGSFNNAYDSIKDAINDTPKTSNGNIIRAIKHNRLCGNYRWSYIKSDFIQDFKESDIKAVKIAQYDLNDNLIKIWESINECKEQFPCCQKVCRNQRKSTKGFKFKYIS